MNILILMAGEAQRFQRANIKTPKPMIEVNDKSILEWTTRSLPFIQHYNESNIQHHVGSCNLYFGVRAEHEQNYGITSFLQNIYGSDINVLYFNKTTSGNLQTAYVMMHALIPEEAQKSLLVLDCDNKYDDDDLLVTLAEAIDFPHSQVVCYFDPIDDSTKWAFAYLNDGVVTEIVEKDPDAFSKHGHPLMGIFWFQSGHDLIIKAEQIFASNTKVGIPGKQEFYMSQVPALTAKEGGLVFAHKISNVVPLGTPEDVERFKTYE